MIINGILISERKLASLSAILPEEVLRYEYELMGFSGREISLKYGVSESWIRKLRTVYGIKTDSDYRLRRNSLRFTSLTQRQKDFLYGSLLGDSCITVQSSGSGYWLCRHCLRQESYLLKKAEIMKPFVAKVYYGERAFEKDGELFPYVDARSFALPQFTELRSELYPNGVKTITSKWLEKLTPSGFAFWFFDDGSSTGHGFDITTFDHYFKMDEAKEVISDVLKLNVSISWNDDEGKLHILKDSHDRAWQYIESEYISCFDYKIPLKYRDNQPPSLDGNVWEGSTTGESLISINEYGDNARFKEVIL
jgi:hypothetical protein